MGCKPLAGCPFTAVLVTDRTLPLLTARAGELDTPNDLGDPGDRFETEAGAMPQGFPLLTSAAAVDAAGDDWTADEGMTRGDDTTPEALLFTASARVGDTAGLDLAEIWPNAAGPDSLAHSTTDDPTPPPGGVAAAVAAAAAAAPPPPTADASLSRWPFFRFASFVPEDPVLAPALPLTTTHGSSLSSLLLEPPVRPLAIKCFMPADILTAAVTVVGVATVAGDFDPLG